MAFDTAAVLGLFSVTVGGDYGLQNRMGSMEDGVQILVT